MSTVLEVRVPDIGDFKDVPVLEILVQAGADVEVDTPLMTLESDKATIDVPSPTRGRVQSLSVGVGTLVSKGSLILMLETDAASRPQVEQRAPVPAVAAVNPGARAAGAETSAQSSSSMNGAANPASAATSAHPTIPAVSTSIARSDYAGPAVRALARRLGVELSQVSGSAPRGRIVKEDVHAFVRTQVERAAARPASGNGAPALLAWPKVDFEKFGPIERRDLSRIKKLSGANLTRNWAMIPHVTNFEEADITDLESFRVETNLETARTGGAKVTLVSFLIKAAAAALVKYPDFNASIDGDAIVYKRYCHVGFAADTPNGLMVPIIRDADKKGLLAIAQEVSDLAAKARGGKLTLAHMEGGCFSVSSLGAVSGTGFTPIINAPEVAILGAAKARILPRWNGQSVVPRLILPLSVSWDHRALDGVAAGKFLAFLAERLSDLRRWIL